MSYTEQLRELEARKRAERLEAEGKSERAAEASQKKDWDISGAGWMNLNETAAYLALIVKEMGLAREALFEAGMRSTDPDVRGIAERLSALGTAFDFAKRLEEHLE